MTSLQQQLAAIAATSTHQLDLKAQKAAHGKSLLFEPKVAASQDFNTIFQLCLEGFQDLCRLDSRFSNFTNSLFSEQSKLQERTQMTKQENEELDTVLRSFLTLAAARLLLKPAIKAVEWLVRRFRVHEYNTEHVLLTFLPYHSTPLFLALLAILPRRIPQAYRFLHPYINTVANPPREAIVYTATNNPVFFTALSRYVVDVSTRECQYSNLLSFWATVAAQAINGMLDSARSGRDSIQRQRQEDVLLRILPIIRDALALKKAPELHLACFMLLIIVANKASLTDELLSGFMEAVVKSWGNDTVGDGLVCLAILAQEREAVQLPKAVVKKLVKLPGLGARIVDLSTQCRIDRLAFGTVLGVLDRLGKADSSQGPGDIENIVRSNVLTDQQLPIVVKSVLDLAQNDDRLQGIDETTRDKLGRMISSSQDSTNVAEAIAVIAQEHGVNSTKIERNLGIILRSPESPPQEMIEDDVDETPTFDSFGAVISQIPERIAAMESFLEPERAQLYDQVLHGFLLARSSEEKLDRLYSLPILNREERWDHPLFFSFLARTWCGPVPSREREAALLTLSTSIRAAETMPIDLQALLPYIVHALADEQQKVRRSAADCALALGRCYRSGEKRSGSSQQSNIWAVDTIYGSETEKIQWMSTQDAGKFLSAVIIPCLEECTIDSGHISNVLASALNGESSVTDKKEQSGPRRIKSSIRSSTFAFLASHIILTPRLGVRLRLLSMLKKVGKTGSHARSNILIPAVRSWTSASLDDTVASCRSELVDPSRLFDEYMSTITSREQEGLSLLLDVIRGDLGNRRVEILQAAIKRAKIIWPSIKSDSKIALATLLLHQALDESGSVGVRLQQEEAYGTLISLSLPSDVLTAFVESLPTLSPSREQSPISKRRRTDHAEMVKVGAEGSKGTIQRLRQITMVLELIESSGAQNHPGLLKGLFHLLSEIQHYRAQTDSDLVYLQSLVIGNLLSIVDTLKNTKTPEVDRSVIRTDLLVDCVRTTSNPQVQNSALLLISSLAVWVPELVLHSVMPIFTFMSATLLRQGDDYSAHVISETVSRVIPPLVTSLRKRGQDLVTGAAEILLSFTAAFEHVPFQRRLSLFGHLITTLGPDDSLFAIIAMLIDRYPTDKRVRQFAADLMHEFDTHTQLTTVAKYLHLLQDSLGPRRSISEVLLGLKERDENSMEDVIRVLLDALAELLRRPSLADGLLDGLQQPEPAATPFQNLFAALLERSIQLSKSLSSRGNLQEASRRVLGSLLDLLPTAQLIQAVGALLNNPDDDIRRFVLRSLESRAASVKPSDDLSRVAILDFVPQITSLLRESPNASLKHSAIACIDRITERFGKKDTAAIITASEEVAQCLTSSDDRLRAASLFCLASAAEVSREAFVPLLPTVLPQTFASLASSIESQSEALHNASLAVVSAVVEHMPYMFSGQYMDEALQLCHRLAGTELGHEARETRLHFFQLAAHRVEVKELFMALSRQWDHAVHGGYLALLDHVRLLGMALERHPKSVVVKNSDTLFELLLQAFDLRRAREVDLLHGVFNELQLENIEHMVNEVALATTMKLNDTIFRPFFVRLVDWASLSPHKDDGVALALRSTSLFGFLEMLLDRLKGLVISYTSYVLDIASDVLQRNIPPAVDSEPLEKAVLKTLSKSFEHDQDDFWQSPSHFAATMPHLVNQLTRPSSPMITELVIPAITALGTAASSADHHKDMDTAILKLMRSKDAYVRLSAVKCQQSLTERLGDDWLGLLPEMLPFISELQEDDDEEVERETQKWIKMIEEILGENLDAMLQ